MKLDELLKSARESVLAKRVFSEPYEVDGVTVITAASVASGGGGGGGHDPNGGEGGGGGFGLRGSPAGAYVVKDGQVRWVPAVDVNRLILGGCVVATVYLLTRARVARARLRASG